MFPFSIPTACRHQPSRIFLVWSANKVQSRLIQLPEVLIEIPLKSTGTHSKIMYDVSKVPEECVLELQGLDVLFLQGFEVVGVDLRPFVV